MTRLQIQSSNFRTFIRKHPDSDSESYKSSSLIFFFALTATFGVPKSHNKVNSTSKQYQNILLLHPVWFVFKKVRIRLLEMEGWKWKRDELICSFSIYNT